MKEICGRREIQSAAGHLIFVTGVYFLNLPWFCPIKFGFLSWKTGGKNAANPVNIYWVQIGHFTPDEGKNMRKFAKKRPIFTEK